MMTDHRVLHPPEGLKLPAIRDLPEFRPLVPPLAASSTALSSHRRSLPWFLNEDGQSTAVSPPGLPSETSPFISSFRPSSSSASSSSSMASSASTTHQDRRRLPRPPLQHSRSSASDVHIQSQQQQQGQQPHPFFDRGRKISSHTDGEADAKELSRAAPEAASAGGRDSKGADGSRLELDKIEVALRDALSIVSGGGRDGTSLSQDAIAAASRETSMALFLLQSLNARKRRDAASQRNQQKQQQYASSSSPPKRSPPVKTHASAADTWSAGSSFSSGADHHTLTVIPRQSRRSTDLAAERGFTGREINGSSCSWSLKHIPPLFDPDFARVKKAPPTAIYEDLDAESNGMRPRPPPTVMRLHDSPLVAGPLEPSTQSPPRSGGAEAEVSYMYAPPSIRERLASLHKEQQRVLPSPTVGTQQTQLPPPLPHHQPQLQHPSQEWDPRSTHRPPGGSGSGSTMSLGRPEPLRDSNEGSAFVEIVRVPPPADHVMGPRANAQHTTRAHAQGHVPLRAPPPGVGVRHSPQQYHPNGGDDGYRWNDRLYSRDASDSGQDGGGGGGGVNKYKKRSRARAPSACRNCGTSETPEWRRGPDGARTLCNACGLHFAKIVKRKSSSGAGEDGSEERDRERGGVAAGGPEGGWTSSSSSSTFTAVQPVSNQSWPHVDLATSKS